MKTLQKYFYTAVGSITSVQYVLWEIEPGLDRVDEGLKWPDAGNPIATIQNFIKSLLSLLALIMVGMALWGGWKIMTSWDKDEWKEAWKKIIINAIIGLVVIFFAWTITNLLFKILWEDTVQ